MTYYPGDVVRVKGRKVEYVVKRVKDGAVRATSCNTGLPKDFEASRLTLVKRGMIGTEADRVAEASAALAEARSGQNKQSYTVTYRESTGHERTATVALYDGYSTLKDIPRILRHYGRDVARLVVRRNEQTGVIHFY